MHRLTTQVSTASPRRPGPRTCPSLPAGFFLQVNRHGHITIVIRFHVIASGLRMEPDQSAIAALKQDLAGIAQSLGDLPPPKLENLDEWKSKAPAIIQKSQSWASVLRHRAPFIAQILDEVAFECDITIAAIDRDRDGPPTANRAAARDKRISELQSRVLQAPRSLYEP